jgi:hypothetical protein
VTRERTIWGTGVIWLTAVLGGFGLWERYDAAPGPVGSGASVDGPEVTRWRVTVFAHPKCPCTRATLRELAELLSAAPHLMARVVFVCPEGSPEGWEHGASWEDATRLAGVEVVRDRTGAEARRFGAQTSGQAVLTDPTGRVVFRGGLTPGRGRVGESAGRRAVLAWVSSGSGARTAPVYGCALFTPEE